MSGSKGTDIDNVKPTVSVYTGATPEGRIKFFGRDDDSTIGFDVFRSHTQDYASIGPAATLALGLTECCAALGRGKVSGHAKDIDAELMSARSITTSRTFTTSRH